MKMVRFSVLLSLVCSTFAFAEADVLVEPLTSKKILDYIDRHPEIKAAADPVDALLAEAPKAFRMRRIFMYRSGSNQAASAVSPRVFMLSADSKFVLSFGDETVIADEKPTSEIPGNSVGGEKNYSIEMQDFDIALEVPFQYSGYKFKEDSTKLPLWHTGYNKNACMTCHSRQSIPRPIWSFYNAWPGAMGSQNQASGPRWPWPSDGPDKWEKYRNELREWVKTEQPDDNSEAKLIRKFLQRVQKNPGRYKHVFQDYKTATPEQIHYTVEFIGNNYVRVKESDEASNLRLFSKGALYNNFLRVHRDLRKKDVYKYIKYALLGAMHGCNEVEPGHVETFSEFIPADIRDMLEKRGDGMAAVISDSVASAKRLDASNQKQTLPGLIAEAEYLEEDGTTYAYRPSRQQKVHRARYIMRSVGMDIYDWFITRQREIGIFGSGSPSRAVPGLHDLPGHRKRDASISEVYRDRRRSEWESNFRKLQPKYGDPDLNPRVNFCAELKKKSLEQYALMPAHLLNVAAPLRHGDFEDDRYFERSPQPTHSEPK
jgi:hypothetical protein